MSSLKDTRTQRPVEEELDTGDDRIIGVALMWSLVVFLVAGLVVAAVAAWFWLRPQPQLVEVVSEVTLPQRRDLGQVEIPNVPFADVTQASGIDFRHENGAYGEKLLPETMGSGCGILDYDGDGDQDILLINGIRWPWDERPADPETRPTGMRLYRNDANWQFQDVTEEAGLLVPLYGMGVAIGDYDNDGDSDVFVTAVGANRLFRNEGGKFTDVTDAARVAGEPQRWSTSATWVDYDRDGRLDLFVCNYVEWSRDIDRVQGFRLDGETRAYGPPTSFEGTYCYLYHNEGDGTFRDVSEEAGIRVTNPATGVPVAKSLGVVVCDFDRDGWMDLIVANDTVPNFLFHNQQGTGFEEIGVLSGVAFDVNGQARGAMGIDDAYFRDPSTLGVAIGNFANEMTALYVRDADAPVFYDAAVATGLGPPTRSELTFGVFFFDYDLDGRQDLLGANGHLEQEINKVQASQRYEQPAQLFWNAGTRQTPEFARVPVEKCGPDLLVPCVGRAAAFADFDSDGDQDVLLTTNGGPIRLLRNDQALGHHWLRVKLVGSKSPRDAQGARIDAHLPDGQVLSRVVKPTRSYLTQVELPVTLGLGKATEVQQLVIHWPDGSTQEVPVTQVDTQLEIQQP